MISKAIQNSQARTKLAEVDGSKTAQVQSDDVRILQQSPAGLQAPPGFIVSESGAVKNKVCIVVT